MSRYHRLAMAGVLAVAACDEKPHDAEGIVRIYVDPALARPPAEAAAGNGTVPSAVNPFGVTFDWTAHVTHVVVERCPCASQCPFSDEPEPDFVFARYSDPAALLPPPLQHPLPYGVDDTVAPFLPSPGDETQRLDPGSYRLHLGVLGLGGESIPTHPETLNEDELVTLAGELSAELAVDFGVAEDGTVRIETYDAFAGDTSCSQ